MTESTLKTQLKKQHYSKIQLHNIIDSFDIKTDRLKNKVFFFFFGIDGLRDIKTYSALFQLRVRKR